MDSALVEQIFASKLLNTRQKWIIVRSIKNGTLPEVQIEQVLGLIKAEMRHLVVANQQVERQYLADLQKWHEMLESRYHKTVVQGASRQTETQHQKDLSQANDILNELD